MAEFQQKVMGMFDRLKDNSYWTKIDADKTEVDLHGELLEAVELAVNAAEQKELAKLW